MPSPSYNPVKQTLGTILSNTSPAIRVPEYQRDFSWLAKHVSDFWHDLIDFDRKSGMQGDSSEYFFGTVVMVNNGKHHLVLDGQQRFATTTILLSVIRDRLRILNPKAAEHIQSTFIAFENPLDPAQQKTYKLELNVFDCDFFRRVIQDEGPDSNPRPRRRSHKLILDARIRLTAFVDSLLAGEKDDPARRERLQRLSAALTGRFGVVAITSDDHDHAASIFETLNERGMGLSTADLLRSWILSTAPKSSRDEIVKLWDEIGASTGEQKIEGVIRTSWLSTHGDVKTRALYKEIKEHLQNTTTTPLSYTRNLCHDAVYLKDLGRGAVKLDAVGQAALDLAGVKATAGFVALLSAHNSLEPKECCILAKALVALAIRHNVIARLDPNRFESAVYECAKAISTTRKLDSGIDKLRAISPTNEELRTSFRRLEFPPQKNRTAQIILRAIENGRRRTSETQIAPRSKVHLEHIYPQKPTKRSSKHDKIVYLLGNLTLLDHKLNQSASNATFGKKKKRYLESDLLITKEVAKSVRWGTSCIKDRQQKLLEEVLRIWPQSLVS